MPNIKVQDAPQLGLSPSETGIEATALAARRANVAFNQAGAAVEKVGDEFGRNLGSAVRDAGNVAVQYAEHREISHGAAAFARLNDDLTQQWNNTAKTADPNDPTVAQKFREGVLEPTLEKYRDSFLTEGGQKFAEARVDSLRNHMFTKTAADMSSLASDAVAINVRQTANSLSNTAMTDPSSVQHLLDSADSLVGGMVSSAPNLKGADSARTRMQLTEKMKESIVKAGAIGAIQKAENPEAEAEKWGKQYPQYISGDELKTLGANARQQIRSRNYDYELGRRRAKEEATDRSTAATSQYLIDVRSQDPKLANDPTAVKILNDPNLLKADKNQLLNYIDRQLKPETDSRLSKDTFVGLLRDMRDPNADPDDVMKRAWDARLKDPGTKGSMTEGDFNAMRNEITARKTPEGAALERDRGEFFKRFAGTVDGSIAQTGLHSTLGSQKMYDAEMDARRQEQALRQKGQDPHSLYDPASPNYFGKQIGKYRVSLDDAMKFDKSLDRNLTGPDKTITGIETKDAAFKPPADWQFSPSRKQYRDKYGNTYDISGKAIGATLKSAR